MDYFVLRFDSGYDKDDFVALQKLYQRTLQPRWWRVLAVVMLLAAIFLILGGILLLTLDGEKLGQALLSMLAGGLLLTLFLFRTRINAWSAQRNTAKMMNLTIKFSAEYVTETTSGATLQVSYDQITRVFHYRERYFLFLDNRRAHILPEAHFAVGDPNDFPAFIEDRTGKQVEYI